MSEVPEFKEQDREALAAWVKDDFAVPDFAAEHSAGERLLIALKRMHLRLEEARKEAYARAALVGQLRALGYRIVDAEGNDV